MRGDGMTMRLVDALYAEAMTLAEAVRDYFDVHGRREREALTPLARVTFTCESLKATTRLMHVIAWLITRRALDAGEISELEARHPSRRLGNAGPADDTDLAMLPETARRLIAASVELYRRVARFETRLETAPAAMSPARGLIARLERAF